MTATLLSFPGMADRPPNRIRALRKARGLTLKQLGAEIGVGTTQMHDLEMGGRDLGFSYMQRLARALQVRPADLLNPEDQQEALAPDELILLDRFRRATPDQLDQLLRMTEIIVPDGMPLRRTA